MAEVEAAHGGGGHHREALRQLDPRGAGVEEVEQPPLLRVVGARGVAEGRPDPAVALRDQLLARRRSIGLVPLASRLQVQPLRERLCEPVSQRLDHDRPIVVVLGLVAGGQLVRAVDPDGERAEMIIRRGDEVGQRAVRPRVSPVRLLAEHREALAGRKHDVVALGLRGPEAVDAMSAEQPVADDLVQLRDGVVVELPRRRLLENRRELPLQLPGMEEELPVDERP